MGFGVFGFKGFRDLGGVGVLSLGLGCGIVEDEEDPVFHGDKFGMAARRWDARTTSVIEAPTQVSLVAARARFTLFGIL